MRAQLGVAMLSHVCALARVDPDRRGDAGAADRRHLLRLPRRRGCSTRSRRLRRPRAFRRRCPATALLAALSQHALVDRRARSSSSSLFGLDPGAAARSRRSPAATSRRRSVFLPWAVPTFLSGLNWAWLFNPVIGPLPHWLYALGLISAARQHPVRSRSSPCGADRRQCLVGHSLLRDHAAGGAAGDPARALRGGRDRRRRRLAALHARSRCRSWRRPSPSPCCCARSGSPTSPT